MSEDFKSYIKNADCFEEFKNIKLNIVNMVLVDLPYGQTDCKWDTAIDLKQMWTELKRICKPNCIFVFFCSTKFGYSIIESKKEWFRYDIVWEKSRTVGFLNAKKQPLRKHEMIYIFSNCSSADSKNKTYNPQKTPGKPWKVAKHKLKKKDVYGQTEILARENKTGDRHPTSIIQFNNPVKSLHPTQKPVDLCEWLIKSYSNPGDIVLDFTMGSGTTVKACINTGRRYIGIEKDAEIYAVAELRINDSTAE